MNSKLLFALILIFGALPARAQYEWLNPKPSGYFNNKVRFINPDTGYIINTNAELIRTTNAGSKWEIFKTFPNFFAMDAKDSIIIEGSDSIVRFSRNYGQSWTDTVLQGCKRFLDFQIINSDTIFGTGIEIFNGPNAVYRSADGGRTWSRMSNNMYVKAFDFINSQTGFISSDGSIFKTNDGGRSWDTVLKTTRHIVAIKFSGLLRGFAASEGGDIYKTINGGVAWEALGEYGAFRASDLAIGGPNSVYMVGEGRGFYASQDDGNSFTYRNGELYFSELVNSVCFTSPLTGYIVGHRGRIAKTTDGGATFQEYSSLYSDLRFESFPSARTGYVGGFVDIAKTNDSGKHWNLLSVPRAGTGGFVGMHFFSPDTGLIVTTEPVGVLKTIDGGQSWRKISIMTDGPYDLYGFTTVGNTVFINAGYGVRLMLRSQDQGETWTNLTPNEPPTVYKNLFFLDEKTGYAGGNYWLYQTVDSGKSFKQVLMDPYFSFNFIWFTDAANGYVVGNSGANYVTRDSAKTWSHLHIDEQHEATEITSIRFFNKKLGYLTMKDGRVYRTINRGLSWSYVFSTPTAMMAQSFLSDSTLVLAGEWGEVVKRKLKEVSVDSLFFNAGGNCENEMHVQLSSVFSAIDSAWVELGVKDFSRKVTVFNSQVTDTTINRTIKFTGLSPDSLYKFRLAYRNEGVDYFSAEKLFKVAPLLAKPVISFSDSLLISSPHTGIQWFLNGQPIAGATADFFRPKNSGIYTVQQTIGACVSPMSVGFNYVSTGVNDVELAHDLKIFPVPVQSALTIENAKQRHIRIQLVAADGSILRSMESSKKVERIDLSNLATGMYWLVIEDNGRRTSSKVLKLK